MKYSLFSLSLRPLRLERFVKKNTDIDELAYHSRSDGTNKQRTKSISP